MYTVPSRALLGGARGRGPSGGQESGERPVADPPRRHSSGGFVLGRPPPAPGCAGGTRTRGGARTANTAVGPGGERRRRKAGPHRKGPQPRRAPFSRQGLGTAGGDTRGSPGTKKRGGGRGNNEATAPTPAPALGLGAAGAGAAGRRRQARAPNRGSRRGAAPIRPGTSPLPSHSPLQMYR